MVHPLQCSCLENPRDGEAWWAAVYGVAESRTRLKRLSSSSSNQGQVLKGTSRRHRRTIPLITCQPVGTKFQSNLRSHHTPFLTPDAPNLCLSHTFKNKFWCGPFLNSIEFVTILLLFCVLVFWLRGMWDLSSLTRDGTTPPCIGSTES